MFNLFILCIFPLEILFLIATNDLIITESGVPYSSCRSEPPDTSIIKICQNVIKPANSLKYMWISQDMFLKLVNANKTVYLISL